MTKSEFRAKSAKKLIISTVILLISNILTGFQAEIALRNARLAESAPAIQIFALVAASLLTLLAARSERKWARRFDGKKYMKAGNLLYIYIVLTVIMSVFRIWLSLNLKDGSSQVFSLLNSVTAPVAVVFSFGIFTGIIAVFYVFSTEGSALFRLVSLITAIFAAANMLLRLVYTTLNTFAPDSQLLVTWLSNGYIRSLLSIVTYAFGLVMFFTARGMFLREASLETEPYNKIFIKENGKERAKRASIAPPPEEGFGIDTEDEQSAAQDTDGEDADASFSQDEQDANNETSDDGD